jgi:CcmD family protein
MGALVAAYLIVWLGVVLYLARLGARQARLERRLEALRAAGEESETGSLPRAA